MIFCVVAYIHSSQVRTAKQLHLREKGAGKGKYTSVLQTGELDIVKSKKCLTCMVLEIASLTGKIWGSKP